MHTKLNLLTVAEIEEEKKEENPTVLSLKNTEDIKYKSNLQTKC